MSIDKCIMKKCQRSLLLKASCGFLLIELIIATLIFSVTMLALFQYSWTIVRMQEDIGREIKAISLAGETIEDVLLREKLSDISKETNNCIIKVKIRKFPYVRLKMPPFLNDKRVKSCKGYRTIEVTVCWKTITGNDRTYKLITGLVLS